MNQYYSIKEILNETSLTRRLITLRVNKLKKIYPHLIKGGMQGKKYQIHNSLLENICKRKNNMNNISVKSKEYELLKKKEEMLFNQTDWTYFFTINTATDNFDDDYLINLIPKFLYSNLFYSIHFSPDELRENRHVHFVLKTQIERRVLKSYIRRNIGKSVAEIYISNFDTQLKNHCFKYLTTDKPSQFGKSKQRVYSYGLIEGMEEINTHQISPV
jgi:hypothetical protein